MCPEGPSKLRFPDYVTIAQNGGKLIRLITGPMCPEGPSKLRFPNYVIIAQNGGK